MAWSNDDLSAVSLVWKATAVIDRAYTTPSAYICTVRVPGAAIIGGTGGTRPPQKFWLGGRKCKHPPNNCHF